MAANASISNLFSGRPDADLNLWDAGSTVAAGATASSAIIDLARGTYTTGLTGEAYTAAKMFAVSLDFTVLTTTGGGDTLTVSVQLSNSATFASGNVTVAQRVYVTGDTATAPRRCNLFAISQDHATNYRYLRVQIVSASNGAATFGGYVTAIEG